MLLILVPTPNNVLSPTDYTLKFTKPFIEKIMDVKGDEHCGFRAIAKFLGLTEESYIMVRIYLIQVVKDHMNDYVWVFESEDHFNYILNDLHPPQNSSGIGLVDNWLTFPGISHYVANYYNRLVVELTNHEIRTSESFFPIVPPHKEKNPIMRLRLIPNHFVLVFLKDVCPLPPSSTE